MLLNAGQNVLQLHMKLGLLFLRVHSIVLPAKSVSRSSHEVILDGEEKECCYLLHSGLSIILSQVSFQAFVNCNSVMAHYSTFSAGSEWLSSERCKRPNAVLRTHTL